MRYRLRTLLIVLALGPPVLAAVWWMPWIIPAMATVAILITISSAVLFLMLAATAGIASVVLRIFGSR